MYVMCAAGFSAISQTTHYINLWPHSVVPRPLEDFELVQSRSCWKVCAYMSWVHICHGWVWQICVSFNMNRAPRVVCGFGYAVHRFVGASRKLVWLSRKLGETECWLEMCMCMMELEIKCVICVCVCIFVILTVEDILREPKTKFY